MGWLNRYSVRIQQKRKIILDAQNASHAKALAEEDVTQMEDAEKISSQGAKLLIENSGVSEDGNHILNRYEVVVRFRRNIVVDAESNADARYWAEEDQKSWDDTEQGSVQYQHVTFMRERTGTT